MGLISEAEAFPKIQARLDKVDPSNQKVVHVFKLKIKQNGEIVKTMMLDLVKIKFYEGDEEAECTLVLDDALLNDIVFRRTDGMEELKDGRLVVEGNLDLLMKLKEALSGPPPS
jgi:ubiquinone biosynthesis protein UbiJ